MRLSKSWARQQYEACYRYMRRGFNVQYLRKSGDRTQEVIQAADYSYQASCYEVHGWTSDRRKLRFHQIVWRILTESEGLPF